MQTELKPTESELQKCNFRRVSRGKNSVHSVLDSKFKTQNSKLFSILFILLMLSWLPRASIAQEIPTDYQIKAKYLEKFGKFIQWPDTIFAQTNTPMCIGIFGGGAGVPASRDVEFVSTLQNLAARDTVNGHPVTTILIKAAPDLRCCQIVFIPATMKTQQKEILDEIKNENLPILTVGESDDFCADGGMVQFVIENQQVHFMIKNEAARAAGLKISSKLLTLAKRAD